LLHRRRLVVSTNHSKLSDLSWRIGERKHVPSLIASLPTGRVGGIPLGSCIDHH